MFRQSVKLGASTYGRTIILVGSPNGGGDLDRHRPSLAGHLGGGGRAHEAATARNPAHAFGKSARSI